MKNKTRRILLFLTITALALIIVVTLSGCNTAKRVTFQSNGGSEVEAQQVSGGYATEPEAPTRRGYDFVGWDYRGQLFDFASTRVTENITLVARWRAIEYTVTFENCEGVTLPEDRSFTVEDASYTLPTAPVKEGCDFLGWYSDAEMTVPVSAIDTSVCENVTVYAKWSGDVYSIEYVYWDNPSADAPTSYRVGETVALPSPEREHYVFVGWHRGGMSGELITELDSSFAGNVKLYAEWQAITYTITYKNCEGATHSLPSSYTVNSFNIPLTPAERAHYSFLGWFSDEGLTQPVSQIICAEGGNITLYASFTYAPHTFESEWSYDEEGHWRAASCGHDSETDLYAAHTLSGNICTVCEYDDGLRVIRELIESFTLTASRVTTSVDTGLAPTPMTGEYNLTFNTDGSISITYAYDVFTDSDSWTDLTDPYETAEGTASVDSEGVIVGGVTERIVNTGALKLNLNSDKVTYRSGEGTVSVTISKENAAECLGFECDSSVSLTFTLTSGRIDALTISFSEAMGSVKVPVTVEATYTY